MSLKWRCQLSHMFVENFKSVRPMSAQRCGGNVERGETYSSLKYFINVFNSHGAVCENSSTNSIDLEHFRCLKLADHKSVLAKLRFSLSLSCIPFENPTHGIFFAKPGPSETDNLEFACLGKLLVWH